MDGTISSTRTCRRGRGGRKDHDDDVPVSIQEGDADNGAKSHVHVSITLSCRLCVIIEKLERNPAIAREKRKETLQSPRERKVSDLTNRPPHSATSLHKPNASGGAPTNASLGSKADSNLMTIDD